MSKGGVLVTGAAGFVGRALCQRLVDEGQSVTAVVRAVAEPLPAVEQVVLADLVEPHSAPLLDALRVVDTVVHAAAKVHQMAEPGADDLLDYRRVNRDATLALAQAAVDAGVSRFIFVSTVKVLGDYSSPGCPFSSSSSAHPPDAYALSKWEAEQGLMQLARETGLELVIIRPPLCYGPGVKANFDRMVRWVRAGWPLPLGAINNQRSLVALANLVDLIRLCIEHPNAAGRTFMVSDGDDMSTPQLLRRIAAAAGRRVYLLPVPVSLIYLGAGLLRKRGIAERLCGSLQVDISDTCELLGWQPPCSVESALAGMFL